MVGNTKCVTEDFGSFLEQIRQFDPDMRIADYDGGETIVPEFQKVADEGVLVRAPNFIIVSQNGHHSLVVLDENASLDNKAVGLSYRHKVKANPANRGLLTARGFSSPFIHPMFDNADGFIEKFYIDAAIAGQAALYPDSRIIIPAMRDGAQVKVMCRIDAFLDVMYERFGSENVINANVARKRWQADVLRKHILQEQGALTRFAPSPTGSLHFGSLRSALVPYLLALSTDGRFTLRFDDTNQEKSQEHFVEAITEDLKWLGLQIEPSHMFRQSDPERLSRYGEVLKALVAAGFTEVKNGEVVLKRHVEALRDVHWMDWHRGPQYIHRLQAPKNKDDAGNLILADEGDDLLRYKIIGAFHDAAFSRVFRDFGQEYLTQCQAYIRGLMSMVGIQEVSGSPPVYGHVPLVAKGKDGNRALKYSKSTNAPEEGIRYVRENDVFLPESVLCGILMTIIPRDIQKEPGYNAEDIYDYCAEYGLHDVLEHVAKRFSMDWVDHGVTKQYVYFSKDQIPKIERQILRAMPFERFKENIDARFDVDEATVQKIYEYREEFSGWNELSSFIDDWYSEKGMALYIDPSQELDGRSFRKMLMGKEDGPALEVLMDCIPLNRLFTVPLPSPRPGLN